MQYKLQRLILSLLDRFGTCPTCIHKAFLAAFAAWTVTLALFSLRIILVGYGTATVAVALTTLWLFHLLVYTGRTVTL
jgi:hypothetical protein